MKKFLITLLYASLFLSVNFSDIKIDAYAKNRLANDSVLLGIKEEIKTIENTVEEEKKLQEEAERLQKEAERLQEEAKKQSYNVVQTSTVEEQHNTYTPPAVTYGTYGRLYVSWFDVALYDYNVNMNSDLDLQQIVDNYDSAAYYETKDRLVIADHSTQGFNVLNSLSEGSTSYIKFADGSSIGYRLIKKETGYNTGPDLVDNADNSFFDMDSDLIMYTCYGDGIMVTLWVLA